MSSVPVTTIEDTDGVTILCWEAVMELDKAAFVVDLSYLSVGLVLVPVILTLSSGLDAMFAKA
jgi:hypothetical protein